MNFITVFAKTGLMQPYINTSNLPAAQLFTLTITCPKSSHFANTSLFQLGWQHRRPITILYKSEKRFLMSLKWHSEAVLLHTKAKLLLLSLLLTLDMGDSPPAAGVVSSTLCFGNPKFLSIWFFSFFYHLPLVYSFCCLCYRLSLFLHTLPTFTSLLRWWGCHQKKWWADGIGRVAWSHGCTWSVIHM